LTTVALKNIFRRIFLHKYLIFVVISMNQKICHYSNISCLSAFLWTYHNFNSKFFIIKLLNLFKWFKNMFRFKRAFALKIKHFDIRCKLYRIEKEKEPLFRSTNFKNFKSFPLSTKMREKKSTLIMKWMKYPRTLIYNLRFNVHDVETVYNLVISR